MPTVSVIIPARNAGRWIEQAIRSAAMQTLAPREIIVIDNASSDDTCAVVQRMRRVVASLIHVRNPRDLGPAASRNIGFDRASGDWLALLDADDWFAPDRLRSLILHAERTGAAMVADNQLLTSRGGTPTRLLFRPGTNEWESIGLESFLRRDRFVKIGTLGAMKPIFRASFVEDNGLRYDEDPALRIGEDALFYISCLLTGESILLYGEALYFYRQHRESLSHKTTAAALSVLRRKNLALLRPYRATAPSSLATLIDQRISDIEGMIAFREIVGAARARHWAEAARCLLRNWMRAAFLIRRAGKSCVTRTAVRGAR
jgi:glycosyltransferase involved in cell wall biosynthesis